MWQALFLRLALSFALSLSLFFIPLISPLFFVSLFSLVYTLTVLEALKILKSSESQRVRESVSFKLYETFPLSLSLSSKPSSLPLESYPLSPNPNRPPLNSRAHYLCYTRATYSRRVNACVSNHVDMYRVLRKQWLLSSNAWNLHEARKSNVPNFSEMC